MCRQCFGGRLYSPPATIGNLVWLDENGNGLQDPSEPGFAGVDVQLLDGATVIATVTTDEDGGYTLDDIAQLIPDTHRAFIDEILERYDVPELPTDDTTTRSNTAVGGHDGNAPFSANAALPQLEVPSRAMHPSSPTRSDRHPVS